LGRLDPAVVRAFEEKAGVNVRVDFVASGQEYENRLRSSPHAWDVVVADEQRLAQLYFAKVIRPLPASAAEKASAASAARPGAYAAGEAVFAPLMADPLGLAWVKGSLGSKDAPTWDWLANPTANPLWRSRIALPSDKRLQFLIAAAHVGLSSPYTDVSTVRPALEWLSRARHQARANASRIELEFLSGRAAAAVLWKSDFERVRKLVPELQFAVPKKAAFLERHGAALVAESFHENEALALIASLRASRAASASAAGLLSIEAINAGSDGHAAASWRFTAENLPIVKAIEAELDRL
jgi:spermidine/putrescine-binding protein